MPATPDLDHRDAVPTTTGGDLPDSLAESESDVSSPPEDIIRRGGTFESFRHRGYLLFWSGALVSNVGTWMQAYVIGLIAFGFRHSEIDTGLMAFAGQIPALFLTLPGGVLADRLEKSSLIIWSQVALMAQAIAFGVLYGMGYLNASSPLSPLFLMGALGLFAGVVTSLSFPAWQAIIPDLVPREQLLNAIALNSAQFQSGRMLGGAAAAAVVAAIGYLSGISAVFWINAASFVFVIVAVWAARRSPHMPERRTQPHREGAWTSLKEGVRYATTHRLIGIVILTTIIFTFSAMPTVLVLLPSLADKVLHQSDWRSMYGVLFTANGFGALVGALTVASLPHSIGREKLMRWSMLATGAVILFWAFVPNLWISVALSALAGAGVLTTNSLANTSVQANVPHRLRGRVMSVFITGFLGIMPIAAAVFGPLAAKIGTSWAMTSGAVLLLAWTAFLFLRPGLLAPEAVRD